jgi:hypothetical protein
LLQLLFYPFSKAINFVKSAFIVSTNHLEDLIKIIRSGNKVGAMIISSKDQGSFITAEREKGDRMKTHAPFYLFITLIITLGIACSSLSPSSEPTASPTHAASATPLPTETLLITQHLLTPAEILPAPRTMIEDVESSGTGPEGRAPYGDSYKLNRFERPFLNDMTYVPDLDIHRFGLSEDEDWYYVSIQLIGKDPNNALSINYGAEIDLNEDGFGDYIVWAQPPYTPHWSTDTVRVFQDSNQDTGGRSALQSDADFVGDGYDTLVFDGSAQGSADPDLAWVRMNGDTEATLQIAFKKSLSGAAFLLGVVSDAGLKDVSKFDYADHFTDADAGSPVKNSTYFPLGLLYAVDNTCWEAYGIDTTGYEPKLCQPILQPVITESADEACNPPPDCGGGPYNPETCACE